MVMLVIDYAGDGAFQDVAETIRAEATWERIAFLEHGTDSGQPSVMILLQLPNGDRIAAQTTYRLLETAVAGYQAYLEGKRERGA